MRWPSFLRSTATLCLTPRTCNSFATFSQVFPTSPWPSIKTLLSTQTHMSFRRSLTVKLDFIEAAGAGRTAGRCGGIEATCRRGMGGRAVGGPLASRGVAKYGGGGVWCVKFQPYGSREPCTCIGGYGYAAWWFSVAALAGYGRGCLSLPHIARNATAVTGGSSSSSEVGVLESVLKLDWVLERCWGGWHIPDMSGRDGKPWKLSDPLNIPVNASQAVN